MSDMPEHTLTVYDHPEPHSHRWSDLELEAIKRYAEAYALQAVEALRPVSITDEQKNEAWVSATIELPSLKHCYMRGIADAEAHHHHITQKEQDK